MRIHQNALFLNSLVADAREGRLTPAAFQRPYVWTQHDVLALVESILAGYPLGGFLLWSPHGKADISKLGRRRLGPVEAQEDSKSVSLLLDGQNRLATLAWMGHDISTGLPADMTDHETEVWGNGTRLMCDLAAHRVLFVQAGQPEPELSLPMSAVVDTRKSNQMCRDRWDNEWAHLSEEARDHGLRWLDECQNALRDTRVVVTDMESATIEQARDAFLHICKVGVPMSEADFDAAFRWAA